MHLADLFFPFFITFWKKSNPSSWVMKKKLMSLWSGICWPLQVTTHSLNFVPVRNTGFFPLKEKKLNKVDYRMIEFTHGMICVTVLFCCKHDSSSNFVNCPSSPQRHMFSCCAGEILCGCVMQYVLGAKLTRSRVRFPTNLIHLRILK